MESAQSSVESVYRLVAAVSAKRRRTLPHGLSELVPPLETRRNEHLHMSTLGQGPCDATCRRPT